MMKKFLTTKIGRLRLIAFLEGVSLIVLLGIAMPMKYIGGYASFSYVTGLTHGVLFLLFLMASISVAIEYRWKFGQVAWFFFLTCVVPFGSFYADHTILSKVQAREEKVSAGS